MKISLNCFQRDQHGNCIELAAWNFKNINTKIDLNIKHREEMDKLIKLRKICKKNGKRILFRCSCKNDIEIEMSLVLNDGQYYMRDLEVGKHLSICPFFTKKRSNIIKKISFNESMFMFPSIRAIHKKSSSKSSNYSSAKRYSKQTFSGIISCILDNVNINLNLKNNFSAPTFCSNFIGEFLNFPFGREDDETFSSYRKNLCDFQNIYFDTGFIAESKLIITKDAWNNEAMKYLPVYNQDGKKEKYQLTNDFIFTLSHKKYTLGNNFLTYKENTLTKSKYTPIVEPIVLQETLKSLVNHDHITNGPYFYMALYANLNTKHTKIVQFILQPIFIEKNLLLPVESDFERLCLSYLINILDSSHYSTYKPISKQDTIFFENLKIFLEDYPEVLSEYITLCNKYSKKKFIRPDLFLIVKNKLYIFEFAGYMDKKLYRRKLEKKERDFYNLLGEKITYIRIEKKTMTEDFIRNGF